MNDAETFQIEEPERKTTATGKTNGSGRLLLGIGIGCSIAALLCCGIFGGFGWWVASFAANAVTNDPEAIRAATEGIAAIEIPERFVPDAMLRIDPPFFEEFGAMVVYRNDAADETLVLGDYRNMNFSGRPPSEVFQDMETNVRVTINGQEQRVEVDQDDRAPEFEETNREAFERPMRGGTARFEIIEGKNTETGKERIVAYGTFPGHRGGGFFMLSVDAENSSVDDVKEVIESVQ